MYAIRSYYGLHARRLDRWRRLPEQKRRRGDHARADRRPPQAQHLLAQRHRQRGTQHQPRQQARITSYNVCYTKLLRVFGALLSHVLVCRASVPPGLFLRLRKALLGFIVYSLIAGFVLPGIDNAAHVRNNFV